MVRAIPKSLGRAATGLVGVSMIAIASPAVLAVPTTTSTPSPATPSLTATTEIAPRLLSLFRAAGAQTRVPWEVLAGLAWEQSRDGTRAPGETLTRNGWRARSPAPVTSVSDREPMTASLLAGPGLGGLVDAVPQVLPELVPPITQPGYGMWLLTSPTALGDDPQNVADTVHDMATLLARDADRGKGGLPGAALESGDFATSAAAQAGWAKIIGGLPVVLQDGSSGGAGPSSGRAGGSSRSATEAIAHAIGYVAPPGCTPGSGADSPTILGPAQASETQTLAWYDSQGWYAPTVNSEPVTQIVHDYYSAGAAEGVRADWAFVQAVLETGGFRNQDTAMNNFAGIGHPDWAPSGMPFPSVAAGVTGHIQLLKRVAVGNGAALTLPLAPGLPTWGGREATTWAGLASNWASAPDYATSLDTLHQEVVGGAPPGPCALAPPGARPGTSPSAPSGRTELASSAPAATVAPVGPAASGLRAPVPPTTGPPRTSPAPHPPGTPPGTAPPPSTVPGAGDGRPSLPTGISATMARTLTFALAQLGKHWAAGGSGPDVWDPDGLAQAAYRSAKVSIPSDAPGQAQVGMAAAGIEQAAPGDLIFAPGSTTAGSNISGSAPALLGIYLDHGLIITVPAGGVVGTVARSQWSDKQLSVRRVVNASGDPLPIPPSAPPPVTVTVPAP